jgi:outer membrane protein assembly factor BamB
MCVEVLLILLFQVADWPQFLGPSRNGVSSEQLADDWSSAAPKVVWKKTVGAGFAGPVVISNTAILFHRQGESEILEAFDAQSGATKWKNEGATSYHDDFGFDEGPRAVPAASGGRIYAMGAEGTIRCVDLQRGKTLWTVKTKDEYKAQKGFFGMACSPLLDGDKVIVNIGGESGAGLIALDAETGKLRWKSRSDEASYSSPVLAELGGKKKLVAFTREALCVIDPASGAQQAEFPWRARMHASVNAAAPLVVGNLIFLTASYGAGAVLLEWNEGHLQKVWSNDESLSSHYATPVYREGYLYGFHGRQEYGPSLRCIELKSGKITWSQDRFGAGTVTLAGDKLLIVPESGELTLAKASPSKFTVLGKEQILGTGVRAYPALSDKRLFARDRQSLVCVQLP